MLETAVRGLEGPPGLLVPVPLVQVPLNISRPENWLVGGGSSDFLDVLAGPENFIFARFPKPGSPNLLRRAGASSFSAGDIEHLWLAGASSCDFLDVLAGLETFIRK
eukprot:s112_g40.t1